jgi:hypothetical protein
MRPVVLFNGDLEGGEMPEVVLVYPSDFGDRLTSERKRIPKRIRRMSKRKVKRWLASELRRIWDASKIRGEQ